eukprot:CAMPEP_0198313986 /NCGR_PEP_ID=MMETSP1450-20131203/4830_1 /TAXON_ID=753684 ORGANISM="Madagascaria erythrocladiodes, Strain CCMP3234" /NCGR_SAMPLE_ID=MMETSP1450 /ASSEMBLY_ACC=CAM_ASM_001115 /LENGTH=222 /DNA_ID=CAMNT_0044017021 /DNA_START=78 /DNA_END=744 /DNA_ORIENTATION=+
MAKSGKLELLTPDNCAVIFIDHQPAMTAGVQSADRQSLFNNTMVLAKAAKVFGVPTVLTTVESESFSGYMWPQLLDVFPEHKPIERTSMNSWDDKAFVEAVKKTGRKKLVIAALWTEVCLTFPTLDALAEGFEVYAVVDASAGTTTQAHDAAISRITQAGAVQLTAQQFLLEMQRDWANKTHYGEVMDIVKAHGGAYGQSVEYAITIVHKQPASREKAEKKE